MFRQEMICYFMLSKTTHLDHDTSVRFVLHSFALVGVVASWPEYHIIYVNHIREEDMYPETLSFPRRLPLCMPDAGRSVIP